MRTAVRTPRPAFLAGAVIAAALTLSACVPAIYGGSTSVEQSMAAEIYAKVNAERAARGLPALRWDGQLAANAYGWSAEMAATGFRHSDLGALFQDPAFAGWWGLGENIFWASAPVFTSGDAHLAWMKSSGHRNNVLDDGFDAIGIGVFCAPDGRVFATQTFGRSQGGLPPMGGWTPPDPVVSDSSGTHC